MAQTMKNQHQKNKQNKTKTKQKNTAISDENNEFL